MTCTVRLLTDDEYQAKAAARIAAIEAWRAEQPGPTNDWPRQFYTSNWFAPGEAYYCPWYFDPGKEGAAEKRAARLADIAEGKRPTLLSAHYWRDWSDKRPPITVFCPNGDEWMIDQVSTSDKPDSGWSVSIDTAGRITCSPSIDMRVDGARYYHGHLQNGRFTASLDGLPPDGIKRYPV